MAIQYDVVYVARSPANTRQEDFASQVDEICNGRAAHGWKLDSAVGDYGAKVTLGVWLYFAKEGDDLDYGSGSSYADEPVGSGASEEGSDSGGYGGDSGGSDEGGSDEGGLGGGDGGFGGDSGSGGDDLGGSGEEPA